MGLYWSSLSSPTEHGCNVQLRARINTIKKHLLVNVVFELWERPHDCSPIAIQGTGAEYIPQEIQVACFVAIKTVHQG